jgi:trehalose-6-phosphatase
VVLQMCFYVGMMHAKVESSQRTTGSHIEVKKSSITWHYRASDPEWG